MIFSPKVNVEILSCLNVQLWHVTGHVTKNWKRRKLGKLVANLRCLDKQIGKYTSKCCMEEFINQVPHAREALGSQTEVTDEEGDSEL